MRKLLDEGCRAVFVDTDAMSAEESRIGDLVQNEVEAKLVHQIAETLFRTGIEEAQVGIISLYRQQIKVLSHLFQGRSGVEILTADRSQGRDKDCIIISMVRSNVAGNTGDLLKDWRRINVALTRARAKLIIIGSRQTLRTDPLLAQFLDLMAAKAWILALPPGADTFHAEVAVHFPPCPPNLDTILQEGEGGSEPRKGRVESAVILKGRNMLKDVVNGLSSP